MLVPNPDLVFIVFRMLMSFVFDGISGVLSNGFVGILIK